MININNDDYIIWKMRKQQQQQNELLKWKVLIFLQIKNIMILKPNVRMAFSFLAADASEKPYEYVSAHHCSNDWNELSSPV